MKKCSYCGAEYPDDMAMCPIDRTPFEQPTEARPPVLGRRPRSKGLDFIYGCFLIGGLPIATYWILALLSDIPHFLLLKLYGEDFATVFWTVALLLACLAGIPAFGFAVYWRVKHRVLPLPFLALEILGSVLVTVGYVLLCELLFGRHAA